MAINFLQERECTFIISTGSQGVGKSGLTIQTLYRHALEDGRKGLIFDVNNEYGRYKLGETIYRVPTLKHNQIKAFSIHPKVEVRRIVPLDKYGMPLGETETENLLLSILKEFRGGIILIEDLNVVFADTLPKKFTSFMVNVRHRDSDTIMHLQSTGRILPKMMQNVKIVRFHYQLDIVDRRKLKEEFEMFRIAQILVDKEYARKNIRFYVNINRIKRKIDGKFSPKMFTQAVKDYLQENEHAVKLISNKKDDYGNRLYNYNQAFNKAILDKFEKYYGNN